ncbi:hypothetical protein JOF29_007329 [Kribbella aluminosa]|uniref:Uncharacterized protein n=1 Tax=Kribbella aluminosa TaxID=416017 RepID=A0ABS4UX45_9ACTN|nr:hypothetical protein [Kribbella aluminosa]MBP2356219.1 hypothetical protein [Kribbella aluminosa]
MESELGVVPCAEDEAEGCSVFLAGPPHRAAFQLGDVVAGDRVPFGVDRVQQLGYALGEFAAAHRAAGRDARHRAQASGGQEMVRA